MLFLVGLEYLSIIKYMPVCYLQIFNSDFLGNLPSS